MPITEAFTQVGIAGILTLMVLDRVFGFLKTRNGNHTGQVENRARQITLEDAVIKLGDNIVEQTAMFKEFHRDLKEIRRSSDDLRKENEVTHLEIVNTLKSCLKENG